MKKCIRKADRIQRYRKLWNALNIRKGVAVVSYMKEITMCNYYGMCDMSGQAVGHSYKVTSEYCELLMQKYNLFLSASPCLVKAVDAYPISGIIKLKHDIRIDLPFTIVKRIIDKIKLIQNIDLCFKKSPTTKLFFYQVDFFFFFYMAYLYHKKDKKVFCLICHQDFTGGKLEKFLKKIYQKALKRIDGVIYTQYGSMVKHPNTCWMPDFIYKNENFKPYASLNKMDKVVCVGTMNRYKHLEELVSVFSQINYRLEIIGRFDDKTRFQLLKENAAGNITIIDKVLSEREYYTKLGEAKYSIIPYDMSQYANRTSGVLIETLFVESIPIAPTKLLVQNNLPGFGYESMEELITLTWLQKSFLDYQKSVNRVKEEYGENDIIEQLDRLFC